MNVTRFSLIWFTVHFLVTLQIFHNLLYSRARCRAKSFQTKRSLLTQCCGYHYWYMDMSNHSMVLIICNMFDEM